MAKKDRSKPELLLLYDVGPRWCEYREALPSGGDHVIVRLPAPVTLESSHWIAVIVHSPLVMTRVGTAGAAWKTFDLLERGAVPLAECAPFLPSRWSRFRAWIRRVVGWLRRGAV